MLYNHFLIVNYCYNILLNVLQVHRMQNALECTRTEQSRCKAEITDAKCPKLSQHFHHRLGWHFMLIKSGQTANHRRLFHCKETFSQSLDQKDRHYTANDWLKPEQWQDSMYLPGLPPDKTNLSSVHVNTGTHRGTLQV